MVRNYLMVMWRNVTRHKLYTAINIIGLTAGMSFALLISVFIWTEVQVNQSLQDVDRLFVLATAYKNDNGNPLFTHAFLPDRVKEQYPNLIESYYRFLDRNITVSAGEKHLRIQSMIGDSTFIQTFGFKVLSGDPVHNLSRPNSIVITEKVAQQFFGRTQVAGETLVVASEGNGNRNFEITAVIATPEKKNSVTDFVNMDAQVFLPLANAADFSLGTPDLHQWSTIAITYLKLTPAADAADVDKILNALQRKEAPAAISEQERVEMKPLSDYYRMTNHGAVQKLLVTLGIIVAFILLLAIANFINITISGSFSRLKEIGVRKVIGGIRRQVTVQFLSESVAFALFSGAFSVVIYQLLRGYAGLMLNSDLPSMMEFSPSFWLATLLVVLLIGLLAGAYPSWYLSRTQTLESLKGKFKSVKGTVSLSRSLIAIQFTISIFILTGALIVSRQIRYFLDKDLGFNSSAVLVVTSAPRLWTPEGYQRMESAKREFLQSPVIESMSLSTGTPTGQFSMGGDVAYPAGQSSQQGVSVVTTGTDEDFISVYGIKMKEGNYFTSRGESQPNAIVINEAAQKALSVQLGDKLKFNSSGDAEYPVVGIVKDFNSESLHESIAPVVILHSREFLTFRHYSIKLKPGNLTNTVDEVEHRWRTIFPDDAFMYSFADERIGLFYKTERQMNKAANLASGLMLIIVMTGVLGLVALSVARRNKEIGIRKVLGASAERILMMLSREYVVIMMASFVAGIPLSYWFVSDWLSTFVYHINLDPWMFVIPVTILFAVTLIMVCVQGISAALSNPVEAIRQD